MPYQPVQRKKVNSSLGSVRTLLFHARAAVADPPWYKPLRRAVDLAQNGKVQEADDLRQRVANEYRPDHFSGVFADLYNEVGALVAAQQEWDRYLRNIERVEERGAAVIGDMPVRAKGGIYGGGSVRIEAEIPPRAIGPRKKKSELVTIGTYPTMEEARQALLSIVDRAYQNGSAVVTYEIARQHLKR